MSAPDSSADPDSPGAGAACTSLRRIVQAIYLLFALSLLLGCLSGELVDLRFVATVPAIAGMVLHHARRDAARGTPLATHFRWQQRTFWFALLWLGATTLLFGPLVLAFYDLPLLWIAYALAGAWVGYRVLRGWLALGREGLLPAAG